MHKQQQQPWLWEGPIKVSVDNLGLHLLLQMHPQMVLNQGLSLGLATETAAAPKPMHSRLSAVSLPAAAAAQQRMSGRFVRGRDSVLVR